MYKAFLLVPRTGFEPAHLAALPPEDSASTNFATWATGCKYRAISNLAKTDFFVFNPFFSNPINKSRQ